MDADARRHSILRGLDLERGRFLEIGPLHRPLLSKTVAPVFYADHCDRMELIKKYEGNLGVPRADICPVDIVIGKSGLGTSARPYGPFAAVIASHVIEHVPDLVSWLRDIYSLLCDDGIVCLAAPDKRFTFDILRRCSSLKDVDEAFCELRWRPSLDTVLDSYRNVVGVESHEIWSGAFDPETAMPGWPLDVIRSITDRYLSGQYVDVHCWVFTPWSLLRLLGQTFSRYSIPFDIKSFCTTQSNQEEFHLQLVKRSSMEACMTDFEEIARFARLDEKPYYVF